jgi:hypothetical protein
MERTSVTPPVSVLVGPFSYRVVFSADRIKELEKESNTELYGITSHGDLEIALQPDCAEMVIRETLLHEVLHALFYNTGLTERLSEKMEEQVIRSLSPALFDLLRRNPALLPYWTGDCE